MEGHAFSPSPVPLPQYLVVCFLLLEPHLDQHSHLLELNVVFVSLSASHGTVEIGLFLFQRLPESLLL